jgi:L-alanine-DL-glutamate epimerase-like enolase superfamily enzyme
MDRGTPARILAMKISRIEAHLLRVPFDMGAPPKPFAGMSWTAVDSLFVRVCTDQGVEGWGEGWGHVACPSTMAAQRRRRSQRVKTP